MHIYYFTLREIIRTRETTEWLECMLLFQGTWVQFPVFMLGSSQLPVAHFQESQHPLLDSAGGCMDVGIWFREHIDLEKQTEIKLYLP